jgi:hypothetical protein
MSTGLKILNATYGTSSKKVDVTSSVSSNIKNGSISLVVTPDSLGVPDPAPGSTKSLNVSYSINNGKANSQSISDNGTFIVSAPPETDATGLEITKAEYGYPGNFTDVTGAIQTHVKDGSIKLKVSPATVGIPDPNPNKQKSLQIEYTLNGAENSATYNDGETLQINAPQAEKPSGNPVDNMYSVGGVMWRSFRTFISALLFFLSWNGAIKLGSSVDPEGKIFTIIGAIPLFSYWGLPFYVFFKRLFSDQDLI